MAELSPILFPSTKKKSLLETLEAPPVVAAQPEQPTDGSLSPRLFPSVVPKAASVLRDTLRDAPNPDEEARKRELRKRFGNIPAPAMENMQPELERRVQVEQAAQALDNAPATAQFLSNPEVAAVASDAVEELSAFEALGAQFSLGRQRTQVLQETAAMLSAGATAEQLASMNERMQALDAHAKSLGLDKLPFISDTLGVVGEQFGQMFEMIADPALPAMVATGAAGGAAVGAAQGSLRGAPGALAGAVVQGARGAAVAAAGHFINKTFQLETAGAYLQMTQQGIPDAEARYISMAVGSVNALLETGGAAVMLKPLLAVGKDTLKRALGEAVKSPEVLQIATQAVKAYGLGVAANITTETLQELTAIVGEEIGKQFRPEDLQGMSEEDITERIIEVMKKATQFSAVVGVLPVSVRMGQQFRDRAREAKEKAKLTEDFQKKFDQSKLLQRAPDLAVQHATAVLDRYAADGPIFIPAEQILKAAPIFDAANPMALAKALGAEEEYFQTQLSLGGDISIPSRAFAQHIMEPNLFAALQDHIRHGVDAMTPAEAKEFEDGGVQAEIAALQKPLPEDVAGQPIGEADGATAGGNQANREGGERQGTETAARGTVSVDFPLATDKETFAPAGDTTVYVAPGAVEQLNLPADKPWRIVQQSDGVYDVVVQSAEGTWESAGNLPVRSVPEDGLVPLTLKSSAPPVNGKPSFAEVQTAPVAAQPASQAQEAKPAPATPIELAEAELGYSEMFKTAAEAGMTPEQYRGYLIAKGQAMEAGRKRKEEHALKRRLKENSESWKKEYETELAVQAEALSGEPVYAAFDGIQQERLSRDQVLAALGGDEAQLAKLPKQKGGRNIFTDKGEASGLDLDTYAQLHDFPAGDVMLFQMMDRPPKSVEAARLAQKEMQAKHGHLLSERQEIDEAIEALHTDQQGALLALELNQLREAQGQGRLKRSLLRQAAQNTLQTMHLTGINPRQFFNTEQRLGRLAGKLLRRGDRATAAKAKFQQVLNFEMAKEAFKVQAQIEKDRRWLLKFYRARSKWTDLPADYLDHIRILLDNFNIETRATVSRGQEIEAWLKAKKAIGEEIEIPARFLAPGGIQNYTDMKLEDWQSFVAKIRELHHRGVTERKLMKAQERATIDELAAEVRAQIDTNLSQVATSSLSQTTFKDRVKKYGREGVTLLLNATSMLREIDGFKDFGPAYTNIKGRIDQALSRGYHAGQKGYLFQQKKQSQRIIKLFEVFSLKERKQFHKRFEGPPLASGKTLTRKEALSILLNSGNSENIKAILDSKELTEQDLQNIWSAAPKKYWDFAQSVWDYLDGFWPDIEAAAMRRNGFAPEKVQAQAQVTPHGVYRGGYYPLRYDNRRSGIPNSESIEEQRQRMRFGNFISSHTAHGHMEDRIASGGRKLLYDPFVLNAHVDQVIYDLEVGDALRDAYRILHHRGVKEGLAAKGRNERFEGLELWLGDVTMGEMRLGGAVEESLRWLRTGYTVSKLAWNFSTIALQPLGLIQSGVQIGHGRMAKALAGVIGNGLTGNFKVFEMVANETQFMAARWETWNRDIIDAQRQLSDSVLARYTPGKSAEVVQRTLFWGLKKAQMIVDTITWLAAHQKGLDDFKGDSQKAKDYADMMVARSQASGIFAERTALERGSASERVRQSELTRAFTVLASYFMAKTNVAFERTKKTNFKSPVQVLMWAGDMAALYTVEAALAALIRGQWPDDEDEEDVGTFLLSETANAVLAGVPIFREFASEAKGFEGGGIVASVASQVGAFLKQAEQGEADDALRKQSINLLGILLRAPSSQVNKTLDAFSRADEGYEVDFWDFIFGPPRD